MNKEKKALKDELKYHCGYCGCVFKQLVGETIKQSKHSKTSSQVRCPVCLNFLKTNSGE